jgi:hypothetical protein
VGSPQPRTSSTRRRPRGRPLRFGTAGSGEFTGSSVHICNLLYGSMDHSILHLVARNSRKLPYRSFTRHLILSPRSSRNYTPGSKVASQSDLPSSALACHRPAWPRVERERIERQCSDTVSTFASSEVGGLSQRKRSLDMAGLQHPVLNVATCINGEYAQGQVTRWNNQPG